MNLEKPSVIFMGTASFGIPTLEIINENYKLKAIVTNYDKPSGRGLKIKNSPVKNYALDNNITINVGRAVSSPIGVDTVEDYLALKKIMEYKV